MYSISDYAAMIRDKGRMDAYVTALREAVTEDSVVLDLGAGTGIFALLACQFGARKVYALEPDNIIQVARELARDNQYEDRIEFIQQISMACDLPEKVDVIISDLRGRMPLFRQHLPSIIDARERFLKPGGKLIPERDTLWCDLVSAPDLYEKQAGTWENGLYNLRMEKAGAYAKNRLVHVRQDDEPQGLEAQCWSTLDYHSIEDADVSGTGRWKMSEPRMLHGVLVWFDAETGENKGFSNAPGNNEHIYANSLLPFTKPLNVEAGDTVEVSLVFRLVGDDYVWNWKTRHNNEAGKTLHTFSQSTFFGIPKSLQELKKRAADYRPVLTEAGRVDHVVLQMLEEGIALDAIARHLLQQFPDRFPVYDRAIAHVGDLSVKYCK